MKDTPEKTAPAGQDEGRGAGKSAARGRTVAIVGRPNVGKSAIFNRLAGARIAIVHAMAGVTRDRLVREIAWGDERFRLIDTGGISAIDGENVHDAMDASICAQSRVAIEDASVAILVVDVTAGLTPLDQEVARILRKAGVHTVVAANKSDTPEADKHAQDFALLGFPTFPVSALHARGFSELMDAALANLPEQDDSIDTQEGLSDEAPIRVAIVGRPNAGKSSFINQLLGSDRMIVSSVPGTTRDSIDIPFTIGEGGDKRHYTLIDTAGAKRDSRIDSAVERYSRYRAESSVERAEIVVLVLDADREIGKMDKQLLGDAIEQGKGCMIAVNKWDLATCTEREYSELLRHEMPFASFCPVVFMSAKTGFRVKHCLSVINYVAEQTQTTIPTAALNRAIIEAAAAIPPPSKSGKQLKVLYSTQTGRNPIVIRIFVNDPARMPLSYRDYLVNQIRGRFGLEGSPVRLQIRKRERPSDKTGTYQKQSGKGKAKVGGRKIASGERKPIHKFGPSRGGARRGRKGRK